MSTEENKALMHRFYEEVFHSVGDINKQDVGSKNGKLKSQFSR